LRRVLAGEGFAVWEAEDGRQAAEMLRRHGREMGVALIDLRMPGPDGIETAAALRAIQPGLACCLMGGYVPDDDPPPPFSRVLHKPFGLAEVVDAVRALKPVG
jgi:CheY-like chemotaxis protein